MIRTEKNIMNKKDWEEEYVKYKERKDHFKTLSGINVDRLYTPEDITDVDYNEDIGYPGVYPFTRGPYPTMYRGRIWTYRMFSGFGLAEDTNKRWHMLLKNGETGLSTAFDFPTLMGRDSDDPLAIGEVGKCGVAIDTFEDFKRLFEGIRTDEVSSSFTINPPAAIIYGMYNALADVQGVDRKILRGTIQNDMLKEFHAQNTLVLPPRPSLKIIGDIFEFGVDVNPKFNLISISGYHIREAGSTAVQELAFTLADGMAYVVLAKERGIDLNKLGPQLSFFFNSHNDFFEEVAKFRAARRIWARFMREEMGTTNPEAWKLKFHTQTAGCSLTAQQPLNNIVRTTLQAFAAVLGGTQSLHTNSFDEAWALPSDEAARVALRTQQIIAYESNVANTIDPLAGSYFVENLTRRIEEKALEYIDYIKEMGDGNILEGEFIGIDQEYFIKEIGDSAYKDQRNVEKRERIVVGVNEFVLEDEKLTVPLLQINEEELRDIQVKRIEQIKERRDTKEVESSLEEIQAAADEDKNIMPPIIRAIKALATEGEIMGVLKNVYGIWSKPTLL
ncbi:MAG: methylmalonyl-CoA mutase [Candidatus Methanoliparum thermophilum]|uniref:Methylmalonyl-CoA mutase n=2 Tax=Candidatus Methanoliparum TaxID=2545692 RepID=A0A520KSK7_METT2|nr:MAG: methylmalonyl-CoA mutase [Candidatus Methanoliparum thermophilum]BDC36214.1 methylmalonyl-CoA mutase [Candidatus Methanoliparum sp. LAM-1]